MIEETLAQYGVLGLWTMSLLAERFVYNKKMQTTIDNNTIAMTKVYEVLQECPVKVKRKV